MAPEMQMTNVTTVVGYLNFMQSAIGADATNGFDVFSCYATEMSLAATPDALLDRINLLLMAGEMDSTLYSQILSAVECHPDSDRRSERNQCCFAARVQTAIYPHHGVAVLQRAVLGRTIYVQVQPLTAAVSANGIAGLDGGHLRPAHFFWG